MDVGQRYMEGIYGAPAVSWGSSCPQGPLRGSWCPQGSGRRSVGDPEVVLSRLEAPEDLLRPPETS